MTPQARSRYQHRRHRSLSLVGFIPNPKSSYLNFGLQMAKLRPGKTSGPAWLYVCLSFGCSIATDCWCRSSSQQVRFQNRTIQKSRLSSSHRCCASISHSIILSTYSCYTQFRDLPSSPPSSWPRNSCWTITGVAELSYIRETSSGLDERHLPLGMLPLTPGHAQPV